MEKQPFKIIVEGNIGSGKSSLLKQCEQDVQMEALYEPINAWTNVGGVSLLTKFYENPLEWGMTLQSYITLTMLKRQQLPACKPIRIMERSMNSARHCFVESMVENGILQVPMKNVLNEWYDFIDTEFQKEVKVDLIVYLDITPEIAYQRVLKRGRTGEGKITLEYLQQLDKLHLAWLNPIYQLYQETNEGTPVYTIDASQSIIDVWKDFKSYIGMWKMDIGLDVEESMSE